MKRRKQGRLRPLNRADRQARQVHWQRTGRSPFLWPHRRGFEQHQARPRMTITQVRRRLREQARALQEAALLAILRRGQES